MNRKGNGFNKVFWLIICLALMAGMAGIACAESNPNDFTFENGVIKKYKGSDTDVVIPAAINGQAVTTIGTSAFYDGEIVSVTVPEGVLTIEDYAFSWCRSLRKVSLPSTLTEMGDRVFDYCTSLEELTIPEKVTSVGTNIIYNCKQLRLVCILSPDMAFSENSFIKSETSSWATEQAPFYSAPIGSSTFQRLNQYGCRCAGYGSFTLKNPLSTDPSKRTRIPALDGQPLSLENQEGITVQKVVDFYTRSDWERNNGSWTYYQEEQEVTGNQWTYSGKGRFWDASDLMLLCRDAAGNEFWAGPFYVRYGVADLNEPKVISPILTRTKDDYPYVPFADMTLTWVPSEDAEYKLTLFEDSGMSLWGLWSSEYLPENSGTVPADQMPPSDRFYHVNVEVRSKTTGESVDSLGTGYFKVYGSELVSEQAVITRPFLNAPMANEEWAPVIPYTGDLRIAWQPVPNAVNYRVVLRAHRKSSGTHVELCSDEVRDGTEYTVPESRFSYYRTTDDYCFSLSVVAYDRYENCTGDTHWYYFHFDDEARPEVYIGAQSISMEAGQWTDVNPGETTLSWAAIAGADRYEYYLVRNDGKKYFTAQKGTVNAPDHQLTVSLEDGYRYILCLKAMDSTGFLTCGWYYMDAGAVDSPVILSPTADYTVAKSIHAAWTDTGAESYSVGLYRMGPDDKTEEYNVFGDKLSYYSQVVDERKGLTGTSCDFDASLLVGGGMYRILVTAHYTGGITAGSDFRFKVEGEPAYCPVLSGAVFSESAENPAVNFRCGKLKAVWQGNEDAVSYEMSLYTIGGTGQTQELIYVARGTAPELEIPSSAVREGNSYMLMLRSYDQNQFGLEYRRYFTVRNLAGPGSLKLPSSLEYIEEEAWMNDTGILCVSIPESVTNIGARAFSGCTSLVYIDIPGTVTSLGEDVFDGCANLMICAPEGSAAAEYARRNGISCVDP